MPNQIDLKAFERRVRLVSAWKAAAIGLACGSGVACIVVAAMRSQGHVAPWWVGTSLVAVGLCVGVLLGALRKLRLGQLADSVDRRAGLKNRLGTVVDDTSQGEHTEIRTALEADARDRLAGLRPAKIYPIRFGRLQAIAMTIALAAAVATLLGNRPIVMSASERAKAADSAEAAAAIERVLEPFRQQKPLDSAGIEERRAVAEMEKLARDLKTGKADREQALQRANKALEEAAKLQKQRAETSQQQLAKAETAMAALGKANERDEHFDPTNEILQSLKSAKAAVDDAVAKVQQQLKSATGASKQALQAQLASLQAQSQSLGNSMKEAEAAGTAMQEAAQKGDKKALEDALQALSMPGSSRFDPMAEFAALRQEMMAATQREIANIKERLKTATGEEAERLRKKLAELEGQLAAAKKELDAYNAAVKKALAHMKSQPQSPQAASKDQKSLHTKFSKQMLSTFAKLKQALNKIESGDELSKTEVDDLNSLARKMELESASAQAAGDKERALTAQVLATIAKDLATGNTSVMVAKACRNGLAGMQANPPELVRGPGAPGYMSIKAEHNIGKVNHLDKAAPSKGSTSIETVDPLKGDGPESYIEVRGPAQMGARSAIPYKAVLPSYQRKEEAALTNGQIPKKHQKRVRAYFDSLNGR